MKTVKVGFVFIGVALLILLAGGAPQAFHSGGVAECEGCHSMHSPQSTTLGFLLKGTDQSSTCLNCHMHAGDTGPSSYHIATALADMPAGTSPLQRTPGGDFGWVRKSYTYQYTENGVLKTETEDGSVHGHNVVAADYGFVVDPNNVTSPGNGGYSSSQLGCQSCHDPHGQLRQNSTGYVRGGVIGQKAGAIIASGSYNGTSSNPAAVGATEAVGTYRLLRGGAGGVSDIYNGATFTTVAIAVAPSTYNQKEDVNQVRVAYGADGSNTWGNWCGTCHPDMHRSDPKLTHPVDVALGTEITNNYNAYKWSGDLTGTSATAFLSLTPFIEGTGTWATLKTHASNTNAYLNGPATTDQVSCMSCHRAHASGFAEMLRFDNGYEFMTKGSQYVGSDNPLITGSRAPLQHRGRTNAEWQAAYYDRPAATNFATYQRVLCNKCHAKD